jgi:hypothetical protein
VTVIASPTIQPGGRSAAEQRRRSVVRRHCKACFTICQSFHDSYPPSACLSQPNYITMSGAPSAAQIRTLYQNTLAASKRFSSYNFGQYFTRRTQQTFEPYLQDDKIKAAKPEELAKFYQQQTSTLEILRRSGEVNRMYEGPQLVIEHALPITGVWLHSGFPPVRLLIDLVVSHSWWRRWSRSFPIGHVLSVARISCIT